MNTTISNGPGYTPPLGGPTPGQVNGSNGTAGAMGTGQVDLEKFYDDVLTLVRQQEGSGVSDRGGNPLIDKNGAPRIDTPSEVFSASDMVDLLRSLRSKTQDEQLSTAQKGLESARIKAEKNTEHQLEKIQEWIDKCKEAESKGALGKIFGWIGKIFAFVAAIATVIAAAAATVATGGSAAPLLALAIVGAISATMTLASAISKECGGPEISINSLIQHTVGKFLTDVCGMDPKQAENVCNIMGGVLAMTCPIMLAIEPSLLGNMAQSIALMAGADEKTAGYIGMALTIAAAIGIGIAMAVMTGGSSVASTAAQVGNKVLLSSIKVFNTVMSTANTVVSGGTQIAQGGLNISKAQSQEKADKAIADKKELEAMMLKLQKQMEEGREEMKKIIQQIEESTQLVSKMIAGTTDNMNQIAMNMGSRSTV
ncbi:type III secretion system translocon subunit SctE [Castellaniella denitrificans]|uniref:Type III secretion system translocon subunit SctE n=1 Tax=Castellaniella denitrificans TaxID=56119 RepID=A0ABT4M5Q0_9BURK|nr:type III secretion system translocon subunit SctE [Castellaniella denitrificans]MCZ4329456.1 type III secretion system translocon subunit SctE [Castellaniella denitrificans]